MTSNKDAPKTYHEFKARFPKLAQAWDLTREGALAGPLDEKTQALIKLAWDNLAIIAPRDATWTVTSPAEPVRIHGYQPCEACHGTGLIFGTHDQRGLRWDQQTRRWRTAS